MKDLLKGSTGGEVAQVQKALKETGFYFGNIDADFGNQTHDAVVAYQKANVNGVVNEYWFNKILSEKPIAKDFKIIDYPLTKGEFFSEHTNKTQICIHLTAGWSNPYLTIRGWEKDGGRFQLAVGTPFVIGGAYYSNPKAHRDMWKDGDVLRSFPEDGWAYHIGLGNDLIEKRCIGIEVCNFATLTKQQEGNYKAWNGAVLEEHDVEKLSFRGVDYWQKITNAQIESLRKLLLYLGDKYKINLKRKYDKTWSDYNEDVISGKIQGVVTHTNFIHPNKYLRWDTPSFPKLIEMLNTL